MAEARQFYQDVLALPLRTISDGALVFDVRGSDLRVSPVPSMSPSTHTVMGFAVADLDATIVALQQRGISVERFAGFSHDEHGAVVTPDGARVAWFRDPDGNILSIVQFAVSTPDGRTPVIR
jgi:predicted enzyme related to lactoylglutathione lyase